MRRALWVPAALSAGARFRAQGSKGVSYIYVPSEGQGPSNPQKPKSNICRDVYFRYSLDKLLKYTKIKFDAGLDTRGGPKGLKGQGVLQTCTD